MIRTTLFTFFFVACGGTVVSNVEGGATSDASATDGTVSSTPKGVACGSATCVPGSETCCVDGMSSKCMPSSTGTCSGQVFRIECDDADDCPGQKCCFTNVLSSAQAATHCAAKCDGFGMFQLCKRPSECANGTCNTYACGGTFGTGSITLGLCATTAPMFCQ